MVPWSETACRWPSIAYGSALAGAVFSNIYYWMTVVAARRFGEAPAAAAAADASGAQGRPEPDPPATVLIPLKGASEGLEENLRRFCRLDYPRFQVIFALEDAGDGAYPIVQRIIESFPRQDLEAVVSSRKIGSNPKENNHANGYARAKHSRIVLADGDVVVRPDYLRAVLAPLKDPKVGLATCPYRFVRGRSFWAKMKAMTIHADFIPSVLLACRLAPVRFGIGATLALRREALERSGGFGAVADFIASDFRLADNVARSGYEVRLIPYWLDIGLEPLDFRRYCADQLRWARTMRFTTPAGYAGLGMTHGLFWALCFLAAARGSVLGWSALAVTWATRCLTAALVWRRTLGRSAAGAQPLLLPLHDLLATVFWALGFIGNEVRWGGRVFALAEDTRIASVNPA